VEIHWPSGKVENLQVNAVDRILTVEEGKGITGALCGGTACQASVAAVKPATGPHQ